MSLAVGDAELPPPSFRRGLLLITVLGLAVRLLTVDHQSLFRDEGHTLFLGGSPWRVLGYITLQGNYPPLYFILVKVCLGILGKSVASLRLVSVISGAFTVPLVALIAYRLCPERRFSAGMLAAILVAFSAFFVASSQEARAYSLFGFFASSLACSYCWREHFPWCRWIMIASATLMIYTDFLAVPLLFSGFLLFPRLRRPLVYAGLLAAPVLCCMGLYILTVARFGTDVRPWPVDVIPPIHKHFGRLAPTVFLQALPWLPSSILGFAVPGGLLQTLWATAGLAFLVILLIGAGRRGGLLPLSLAGVFLSGFLNWKYGQMASLYSRLAMVAPLLACGVAIHIHLVPRRQLRNLLVLGSIVLGAVPLCRYLSRPDRGGWKQLAAYLSAQSPPPLVYCNPYHALMLRVYYQNLGAGDEGLPETAFLWATDNSQDGLLSSPRLRSRQQFVNVVLAQMGENAR